MTAPYPRVRLPASLVPVLILVAACGGGGNPAKTAPKKVSVPPRVVTRRIAFPSTIGSYTATGTVTPDPNFSKVFPAAASAKVTTYGPLGNASARNIIVVEAGQLKARVNPASALDSYLASRSRARRAVDVVRVPAGPAGGQARCWLALNSRGLSTPFCMWVDSSTFGWLGESPHRGKTSTRTQARLMLTFRRAIES